METILQSDKARTVTSNVNLVPFLNLRALYLEHRSEYDRVIEERLLNTDYIGGNEVLSFSHDFAKWVNPASHAVGVANGTDAITLAALSLGIPRGKEAVLPAMTYFATLEGLVHAGFKITLVDVEPGTWHINTDLLSKAVSKKTALIVPVHLYGQMAEMDKIRKIADASGCKILEDAAQAHGASWMSQSVGHWGDVATYSFYPGKNLGAFGDGGAVLSKDTELINKCATLSNHGGLEKYVHEEIGFNSRLDALQAAVLKVKLKYIDGWNKSRRKVAQYYQEGLSGISGLELPIERVGSYHIYHIYPVLVEKREDFMGHLKKNSIECGIHYPKALHEHRACQGFGFSKMRFPQAERLARHGVSLPMCPTLSEQQVERVISTVRRYFGH